MSERGRLEVTMDGNASGFQRMLTQAKAQTAAFSNNLSKEISGSFVGMAKGMVGGLIGALGAGAVRSFVGGIFKEAGELKDLAEQFDVSTDEVAKWTTAMEKAGIPAQRLWRSLETLRAKRQELREDSTRQSPFDELGLRSKALGYETNDLGLLKSVLESSGSRPDMNALLGQGGARLKAGLEFLGKSSPAMGGNEIEDLDAAQKKWNKVTGFFKKFAKIEFLEAFRQGGDITKKDNAWRNIYNLMWGGSPGVATTIGATARMFGWERKEDKERRLKREADEKAALEADAKATAEQALKKRTTAAAKADQETRSQASDILDRLKEVERRNMNPKARRDSLQKELGETDDTIKWLEGMGDEAKNDPWLASLKLKREQLKSELIQKPGNIGGVDSLAKAGLFGGAALNFSTDQSTQREQLNMLKRIDTKLGQFC